MNIYGRDGKSQGIKTDVDAGNSERMISDQYVWLAWSIALLVPWLAAYVGFPRQRKVMVWTSLFTMPFGLTEPLFVPAYWSPPSLFDLARTTGFLSKA